MDKETLDKVEAMIQVLQNIIDVGDNESYRANLTNVKECIEGILNESDEVRKPRLEVDLSGPDGNIFVVLRLARKLLDTKSQDEMWRKATKGGSYENAIKAINEYVELIDTN